MATPFEQEVILDADGKSLFSAMDLLERRIQNIQKTIKTIQQDSYKTVADFNKSLEANIKGLQTAQSQMRTISQQGASEFRQMRATAAPQVSSLVASQGLGKTALGLRYEQELAYGRLMKANNETERVAATRALDLANARVAAVNRLVVEEQRVVRTQAQQNTQENQSAHRARLALSRQYAQSEVGTLGTQSALGAAKMRQVQAEEALAQATSVTRRGLMQNLELENARLRATERLVAQQARQNAGVGGSVASGRGAIGNILSPGYAGAALARTTVYGAAAAAAYGIFNVAEQSLSGVVELQDEFAKLQAISNSTDEQMVKLKNSIFDVGTTSRYSLTDILKMSQTLAQAGVNAADMKDVLKSVTTLATASGSTPDEAVQLVTSALGAFQLQGSEAARVADLMTAALNRTKLTVQQTGQAIQYVGSTAYEQNISLEQMLATIGAVAQGGVKSGSTIGTGFRQFLVDLQDPSKKLNEQLTNLKLTSKDVDVSVRGLPAVLETLRDAGFGASQAYDGLEKRAAAFYLTAKNNIDVMDNLQLSFAQSGAAITANDRAMNSLSAQWQRFKNLLQEGFADHMNQTMVTLQNIVTLLADHIEQMNKAAEALKSQQAKGRAGYAPGLGGTLDFAAHYDLTPALSDAMAATLNFISDSGTLGTTLQNLDRSMDGTTDSSRRLATQLADATDAVDKQQNKIGELDKEMVRLATQKESLRNNDVRSAAETATLTSRFEGLASNLVITGNRYDDLTAAARRYREEAVRQLGSDLNVQDVQLGASSRDARGRLNEMINQLKRDPEVMNALGPSGQAALNTMATSGGQTAAFGKAFGELKDSINALNKTNVDVAKRLEPLAPIAGQLATTLAQRSAIQPQLRNNVFDNSRLGQLVNKGEMNVQSFIERMGGLDNGSPEKKRLSTAAMTTLDILQKELAKNVDAGLKTGVQNAMADIKSLRQQVTAQTAKTSEEIAAEKKAERERKAAEREAERGPLLTQAELDRVAQQVTGLGLGSGPRTKAQEDALHALGRTRATGDTSSHSNGGLARDLPTGPMSRDDALRLAAALGAKYKAMGLDVFVQWESGKGPNQGTGPHIHVSARKGTRFRGSLGAAAAAGSGDAAEKTLQEMQRLDQSQLDLDTAALADQLKDIARARSKDAFDAAAAAAQASVEKVKADLMAVAKDELAKAGVFEGDPQYAAKMAQVKQAQDQVVGDYQRGLLDAIMKNAEAMIKAATASFDAALAPSKARLKVAQSTLSGLDYISNRNKVPDYTRQIAQDQVSIAQEQADRAQMMALPALIAQNEKTIADLQAQGDSGNLDPEAASQLAVNIQTLTNNLQNLKDTRDGLVAAFGADGLIPQTFSEGLNQAIEAYRALHNMNESFSQTLVLNLGGAIDTVSTGLQDMFTSIVDGSRTAMQAFGDFAKAIMKYILQIVAKIIATKIIELLFTIVGGAASGSSAPTSGTYGSPVGPPTTYTNKGGRIGYAGGGAVTNGSRQNRDSVLAALTRGEWVINRRAVDSVGHNFMARLNRDGAKALDNTKSGPSLVVNPHQEMNVWMVPPASRPQMGPNDVLVTWADDVMRGGESRKLIQHVVSESTR